MSKESLEIKESLQKLSRLIESYHYENRLVIEIDNNNDSDKPPPILTKWKKIGLIIGGILVAAKTVYEFL